MVRSMVYKGAYLFMSNKLKKKKNPITREMEIESAKMFGKHMAKEKALVLLVVTMLTCAMPMQLGLRLWDQIPEIVETGLIGANGEDDSLPRAAVVFLVPGLMCLLNLICHGQLWLNQKRMTLPNTPVRLLGRWGFPIISALFCTGLMLESAGGSLTMQIITPCVLSLVLMMLGGHMWDCPRTAKIALRFSFTERSDLAWKSVHRFAGWLWMLGGLLLLESVMLTATSTMMTAVVTLVVLVAPMVYGYVRRDI